jgi:hypothetical protein
MLHNFGASVVIAALRTIITKREQSTPTSWGKQ